MPAFRLVPAEHIESTLQELSLKIVDVEDSDPQLVAKLNELGAGLRASHMVHQPHVSRYVLGDELLRDIVHELSAIHDGVVDECQARAGELDTLCKALENSAAVPGFGVKEGQITPYTRDDGASDLKKALEQIVDGLRDNVSAALPPKASNSQQEDAQRVRVLNAIATLDNAINGLRAADMAETNWLESEADIVALKGIAALQALGELAERA